MLAEPRFVFHQESKATLSLSAMINEDAVIKTGRRGGTKSEHIGTPRLLSFDSDISMPILSM